MSIQIPPFSCSVSGFSLEVFRHDRNYAKEGAGDHLLESGYLETVICCDGTNPFFPLKEFNRTKIVKIKSEDVADPKVNDECSVVFLMPDHDLIAIRVVEDSFGDIGYGVWSLISFRDMSADKSNTYGARIWGCSSG